jgi:hypothetical protein
VYEEGDIWIDEIRHVQLDIDAAMRGGKDWEQEEEEPKSPNHDEAEDIGFPMRYLTVIAGLSPS